MTSKSRSVFGWGHARLLWLRKIQSKNSGWPQHTSKPHYWQSSVLTDYSSLSIFSYREKGTGCWPLSQKHLANTWRNKHAFVLSCSLLPNYLISRLNFLTGDCIGKDFIFFLHQPYQPCVCFLSWRWTLVTWDSVLQPVKWHRWETNKYFWQIETETEPSRTEDANQSCVRCGTVNGLKAAKIGKWFKTQNNFFYCAVFVLLLSMSGCCGSLRPFSLHSSTLIQSLLYFLLLSELTYSNAMISFVLYLHF